MQKITRGNPYPLGTSLTSEGVNFSIYSKHCTSMQLVLFASANDENPSRIIELDPQKNRTFDYWHIHVANIQAGQHYGFRLNGKCEDKTRRHQPTPPTLIDPYGCAVAISQSYDRHAAAKQSREGVSSEQNSTNTTSPMKSVVTDLANFDWDGDQPLRLPFSQTIIYEMHVRGFTQHPNSGVPEERRGYYPGIIDKIPYLKSLGITAVELLPVFQFDTQDAPKGLSNYWGYSPISFFAPHAEFSTNGDPLTAIDEFREMVKALHTAGIEVILDVVYNHTAEGGEGGPTFCYKGLQNDAYYLLQQNERLEEGHSVYSNFSGCGNTLNANHSIVRRLILDSLRFWVQEMHVDGFRFDLASILSRDTEGIPQKNPPILWDIETDPVLSGTKLIAEAWDAAGLYQVGDFFGDRWKEWNGRFRDDVRAFVKGDQGFAGDLAKRFLASPDIYGHRNREPEQSINFITSHDGFTLRDLVSYDKKHNLANQEENRDGHNENLSWNCGHEGPTVDSTILRLRRQQTKNLMMINVLSFGVPMLLMGDEVCRTQSGNNNAYCQDNPTSWFDWDNVKEKPEMLRFVSELIRFRKELPKRRKSDLTLSEILAPATISWHGTEIDTPDWSATSRSVAFTVETEMKWYFLIFNAYWEDLTFKIPELPENSWHWKRIIDTSLDSPNDIDLQGVATSQSEYRVAARSSVLLTGNQCKGIPDIV